jgi:hypothetical protein
MSVFLGLRSQLLCQDDGKKYIRLGHKHLAPGNRVAEKKDSFSAVFIAVERKLLCLKFNLEAKKIIGLGHKHLAPGNTVKKKKGSYSAVCKAVEGKLLFFKFNLEASLQSYREIATRKIYRSGA